MNFGRLFWANLILADSLFFLNIFFWLIWADGALKWAKSEENDIYWGVRCILGDLLGRHFPPKKGTFADNLRYSLCLGPVLQDNVIILF